MASRFWVGGTGNWDAATTTHWSATSGGGGGSSVPGVNDTVTFDGNSGGGTVTVTATQSVTSITAGAFTGTLNTNGQTITVSGALLISGTGTRTVTLGASAISCGSWDSSVTTNLTFNCGTSVITWSGASGSFQGGGLTFFGLVANSTSTAAISGTNTFTNLTRTNASGYASFTLYENQTVTGTFTVTGNNASTQRMYVCSETPGTARTITAAAVSLTNVDFEDVTAAGASAPFTGTLIGDCGGNTSITAATPISAYWKHDGTTSHPITDSRWFTTSGGATPARFPLPQDVAVFDANSFPTTGKTVSNAITELRLPFTEFTGVTNSPTLSLTATTMFYGSLTLVSVMTFSGGGQVNFQGRNSYTLTPAGKTFSNVVVNAYGGTVSLSGALVSSGIFYLVRGQFAANGYDITCTNVVSAYTTTRTLQMGSGTWTLTGTGAAWDLSTTTGLTLSVSTALIVINNASSSAKTFLGGGKTYVDLTFSGAGSGSLTITNASAGFTGTITISNTGGAPVDLGGAASSTYKHIDFTGSTVTWLNSTNAITISGSLTLASGMSLAGTLAISFTATTAQSITSAGKTFPGNLSFDAAGIWTLGDDLTSAGTVYLFAGSLNILAYTLTCAIFDTSMFVPVARALQGSGYLVLTGTGTVFNAAFSLSLTVSVVLTIEITDGTAGTKTFSGGGATYGNILLSGYGTFDFVGSNAFNDFQCQVPGAIIRFTALSVTNVKTLTLHGSSTSHISLTSITANFHYLNKPISGKIGCTYLDISWSVAGSVSTFYARNSTNLGQNTNWDFTATAPVGFPMIRFDGETIEFTELLDDLQVEYPDPLPANISIGGTVEQLGSRVDVIVSALCTMLNDLDAKRQFRNFFGCGKAGRPFSFARYSDDVVLTTNSVLAAAGDMSISLTSTAGIVVGQQYVLRDEFDCEIVKIASVAASSVGLSSPIHFDYAAGSRFRSEEFWPGRLPTSAPILIERPPVLYDFSATFREDVNDI